jgi:outer membrane receptor protein involved in Fe transport
MTIYCKRVGRILIQAGILSLLLATASFAGTRGKLVGIVKDSKGAPLPGVAVTVDGTRLGASTDPDGRYFIMQVPPGVQSVKAQLIGYRAITITNVRVSADLTTETSFTLTEEALEVGAMTVIAKRPDIERDVTSSQTIIDAEQASQKPVTELLDVLSYEPGVSLTSSRNLTIRGGGASEIRFQVDGIDRVDPLTNQAHSQLNQLLVSEVTVLTGGFSPEYGNLRSGVVNAILKDGTEKGFGLPWFAGALAYTPAQKKHFGPGAYDSDQYDYWLMSSKSPFADTVMTRKLYWPELYAETRADTALMKDFQKSTNMVFPGWKSQAQVAWFAGGGKGAYGAKFWTPEAAREAWEWEANMDEQVWEYSHEPDVTMNLGMGWSLPKKLGGILVGYSYDKEMAPVPALIPYSRDKTLETKLTLTPTDNLKLSVMYTVGKYNGTGAASDNANYNPEYGSYQLGSDPQTLRDFGDLAGSISGTTQGNNKLHLSYNSPLSRDFTQFGSSLTYAINPATFVQASMSLTKSEWSMGKDIPRADPSSFEPGSRYTPTSSFSYGAWLSQAFNWTDIDGIRGGDSPISLEDATNPDRVVFMSPYFSNVYYKVPAETKYITHEVIFDDNFGDPDTATVVSPQGWVQEPYRDMSGVYGIGGGGHVWMQGKSKETVVKSDVTHALGAHTIKTGAELIMSELEYHHEYAFGGLGEKDGNYRDYGGDWPTPKPIYFGYFVQDKFESEGMIANYGIRVERFNGGQKAYLADDLFNGEVFSTDFGEIYFKAAAEELGWDTDSWGPPGSYNQVMDSLKVAPTPGDVVRQLPYEDTKSYWRVSPRFGISHPVSDRTKLFFNFGQAYSRQKSSMMYGLYQHNQRLGGTGRFEELYNPNLRPAKTTQYEVGIENVFPYSLVFRVRGYAKYNVDQVSELQVKADGFQDDYYTWRNANYEDIKGAEITISRMTGRFVNGWFTYERFSSRAGNVGLETVNEDPLKASVFTPYSRGGDATDSYQLAVVLGTPRDWGRLKGGWGVTVVQDYRSGGETVYNPNQFEERELDEANFLPVVDRWNTNVKISKRLTFPGRRSIVFTMDILNAFNTRRLNGAGIDESGMDDYKRYIYEQRRDGSDIKYGDESTFHLFAEPYKSAEGIWKPPIAPRTEWMHHMEPRTVRFGASISL